MGHECQHLGVFQARIRNQIQLKLSNDLLERYAIQDSLADIANRCCFAMTLDAEWRRAMRERQPLALVTVDVDRFKHFNDLYGQREGDYCLLQHADEPLHLAKHAGRKCVRERGLHQPCGL